jgi:hypothetical protein
LRGLAACRRRQKKAAIVVGDREASVEIDKQFVIDELEKQGKSEHVQKALDELPAKVDHEQHAALLQKYGIDPGALTEKAARAGLAKL